jgi:predicted nucleic acid-binding protein
MGDFVLDASVAISWCFPGDPTEDTPYSRQILTQLEVQDAIVPGVWPFEIANGIFVSFAVRKRITEEQIGEYLERLRALPIRVEQQDIWANVGLEMLARKWNLTAYDAAYLDLAMRKRIPLATADLKLRAAAASERLEVVLP